MTRLKKLAYRIFFTKDDDMDLTQLYFGIAVMYFFVLIYKVGTKQWSLPTAAWATFGSVFGVLAIAGTSHAVSKRIADSKLPGEIAQGIAQSSTEPNVWKDDERGEHTERDYAG
jgi:hypothetical protein